MAGRPSLVYTHRPRSVAELLLDARRWQGSTFIVEGDRRLGFEAHEHAVARVARALAAQGIGRGERVMLLAHNRLEWIVAFWALQSLGATAVLGNAWWSDQEAGAALDLVEPRAVLTDRSGGQALPARHRPISLPGLRALVDSGEAIPLDPTSVDEEDIALIMFSSGTTGAPKGVVMSHRSVVANIQNLLVLTGRLPDEIDPAAPGTVSLLTVPLFHLAGIQISFSTLLTGGRLALLEGRFDAEAVLRLIERERVRVWGAVPTMVSRVLDHPALAQHDISSLRSLPMGGAAMPQGLRQRIREVLPRASSGAGNLYGLTEAGGLLAAGSGAELQDRPACVGRALPVVELRIHQADAHGVGEILARTPAMTRGYWGDPVPLTDAEGWVRTGDIGRLDDEGWLYVVGRSKDIIIRGGENIAAPHVEQCLSLHPDVLECAVVALPQADLGEEVAAAVVVRPGARLTAQDLQRHAQAHLGRFEIPSRWWLRREALPTTASGKFLKRELVTAWRDVSACDAA
ncbi:MAG: class I adenylate-forming enzyme family protein [Burkholderiales bacterium]